MKMSAEWEAALRGAIAKWERRAEGKVVEEDCPLCRLAEEIRPGHCGDCPICLTGHGGCSGTPFSEWMACDDDDAREYAQKEVDFLKGLLLEGG